MTRLSHRRSISGGFDMSFVPWHGWDGVAVREEVVVVVVVVVVK